MPVLWQVSAGIPDAAECLERNTNPPYPPYPSSSASQSAETAGVSITSRSKPSPLRREPRPPGAAPASPMPAARDAAMREPAGSPPCATKRSMADRTRDILAPYESRP